MKGSCRRKDNRRDITGEIYSRAYYREVLNMIPSDVKNIIDIGCGEGYFLYMLRKRYKVVGLDINKSSLRCAEKILQGGAEILQGEAGELAVKNESFDCVTCLEVLEHLKQEAFIKAIKEIKRVAKKYIIISVPNEEPLEYFVVACKNIIGPSVSEAGSIYSWKIVFYQQKMW